MQCYNPISTIPSIQLTTLSQSSLQDYVDCARRFQLRHIDRLAYPAVESEPALENEKHLREGELFHRLVQQYLIGIPAGQVGRLGKYRQPASLVGKFSSIKKREMWQR